MLAELASQRKDIEKGLLRGGRSGGDAVTAIPDQAARRSLHGTIKLAPVAEFGNPPFSGSADYAGSVTSSLGQGAILAHNDYSAAPAFQGRFRIFYNKGALKAKHVGFWQP
jgi:hypothetical protein